MSRTYVVFCRSKDKPERVWGITDPSIDYIDDRYGTKDNNTEYSRIYEVPLDSIEWPEWAYIPVLTGLKPVEVTKQSVCNHCGLPIHFELRRHHVHGGMWFHANGSSACQEDAPFTHAEPDEASKISTALSTIEVGQRVRTLARANNDVPFSAPIGSIGFVEKTTREYISYNEDYLVDIAGYGSLWYHRSRLEPVADPRELKAERVRAIVDKARTVAEAIFVGGGRLDAIKKTDALMPTVCDFCFQPIRPGINEAFKGRWVHETSGDFPCADQIHRACFGGNYSTKTDAAIAKLAEEK